MVAAEINADSPDFGHLEPMGGSAQRQLRKIGIFHKPDVVVADAGYWHTEQMDVLAAQGIPLLIPPDAGKRTTARPGWKRRTVHLDALPPRDRERPPALPKTTGDGRARVRADRVQPKTHPVSPKRPRRRAQRVATNHSNPQPPEAAPSSNSHRRQLRGLRGRRAGTRRGPYRRPLPADPSMRSRPSPGPATLFPTATTTSKSCRIGAIGCSSPRLQK